MTSIFRTRWNKYILLCLFMAILFSFTLMQLYGKGLLSSTTTTEEICPPSALLSSNPEENWEKVVNYPLADSVSYLSRLGLQSVDNVEKYTGVPVVITATSANHFSLALGLMDMLTSNMKPKLHIVIFDIGMTTDQRKQICRGNVCELRDFPFSLYPTFLEDYLPSIAWKPVLIQMALEEFGFVIWMDSSVYVPDGNLQAGIDIAKKEGIAAGHKRVVNPEVNLAFETDTRTFKALGEEPCAFKDSFKFNAALIFIRRSAFTYKYIMRPWVSCALTKSCIVADYKFYSKCAFADYYGFCHRYDQSVLSIILNRLYHLNTSKIDLHGKVRWTKCFRREDPVIFNEMVFIDKEKDGIQCINTL